MNSKKYKTPNSWKELILLLDYLSYCPPKFLRLSEDENFYSLFRELVPKKVSLEIVNRLIGNNDRVILKNNFPYSKVLKRLKNVEHYCLWSKKGKLNNNQIKKEVERKFGKCNWCYSERKLNKKSVPEIWHCHIFINHEF